MNSERLKQIGDATKILETLQQEEDLSRMTFSVDDTGRIKINCIGSIAFVDADHEIFTAVTSISQRVNDVLVLLDLD